MKSLYLNTGRRRIRKKKEVAIIAVLAYRWRAPVPTTSKHVWPSKFIVVF
jgi:hypothetical protein